MPGSRIVGAGARRGRRSRWLDAAPLAGLMLFSVAAVAGYGVFGRDPSRLVGLSESAVRFYGVSFVFFARVQVLLAAGVLAVWLARRGGWRWLPAFGAVYALSLGSELLGTGYGVPFGPYAYTDLLGWKWFGLVPALIPLSWFFMAVPSYGLASRALAARGAPLARAVREATGHAGAVGRIFLGSLLLLAWDLALDPAMSEVTRYWVWGERGPYYGMPLMNLFGWYVTGVALMTVLEWLGARSWLGEARGGAQGRAGATGWLAVFYAANLILPLGMTLAAGLWGAAVATVLVLGGVAVWTALRSRSLSGRVRAGAPADGRSVEVAG